MAEQKKKLVEFDGDFSKLPSAKQLLKMSILSLETGKAVNVPTTRDAAKVTIDDLIKVRATFTA